MPSEEQLRHSCNLGYAHKCPWRPQERQWDSTRFGVSKESEQRITLRYVCEKDHRPVQHGNLEYELLLSRWTCTHPDTRLQRMAECYLESYLLKKSITP